MSERDSLREVTAAILAGGLGTRLRPVVSDRPKVLAEVHGRSLLFHLLDRLEALGIARAVLCTGYLAGQIREAAGDRHGGLSIAYSQENDPLGTAGALRLAASQIQTEQVLAMNGDSWCTADLHQFWRWHRARRAEASLLLVQVPEAERYGRVQVDGEGRVVRFEEKGKPSSSRWINAGIYLIRRELLLAIPEGRPVSMEREVFPSWIGRSFYGWLSAGEFLDIGTPEAYARAEEFFKAARPREVCS